MTYVMPWKYRLLLIVPALIYLVYAGEDFGRAVGLLPKEPTTLEAFIDAPRDRVFEAFVVAAEIPARHCPTSCSGQSTIEDNPSYDMLFELRRPGTIVQHMVADDENYSVAISYDLQAEGDRTRIVSRGHYPAADNLEQRQRMEHGYEKWGDRYFKDVVGALGELARSDEV